MAKGWSYIAAFVILLTLIGMTRGPELDRLVTPDEPTWLTNSANFYYALAHRDFANTYQIEHPGVTTMWLGTFGYLWRYPAYAEDGPGQINWWEQEVSPVLRAHGQEPLELLAASRLFMVLANTLVLAAAFLAGSRLIGFWPALAAFLLLALDPFPIALSRLLHLDGLLSSLILLSLLSFLNFLYRGQRFRDLALSAVAAGLAWLTKSPGLFLIPFTGLLLLLELVFPAGGDRRWNRAGWLWAVKSLVMWGLLALAVFVLLWPAMWVDPLWSAWRMLRAMAGYAAEGHEAAIYFNGAIIAGDPGWLFYPLTYLWRATPLVIAGLALTLLGLAAPRLRLLNPGLRRPLASLGWFAVLFTLFMSLGAKKFDRYLLPVYLPLDLLAGVGWASLAGWIGRRRPARWGQMTGIGLVGLALVGQAVSAASTFPYYLSYYNPLLGGTRRAPQVMMIGWGEGLDQAAQFLNSQAGAENLQVVTGVWNGTFSYFFKGQVKSSHFMPGTNPEDWSTSDYYVIYINEWQRGRLPPELMDYLEKIQPVRTIQLQGLEYVHVYDLRNIPPPGFLLSQPDDSGGT